MYIEITCFTPMSDDASSNPSKGILHNVAAQVKAKLNVDMELQYITRHVDLNPRDLPLKETTLFLSWPESYNFYGQGRSKKIAERDAADHALQFLKSLNVVTEDGQLSIMYGGEERRRKHRRKQGHCEDGRKRKEDQRRKWDKDQETGNWGCRTKEKQKDVHHGSFSERGKCIYNEMDWWNEDGVTMDEELYGDYEGERAAEEEFVDDWWNSERDLLHFEEILDKSSHQEKKKGFPFIKGSILCSFGIIGLALYDINKHHGIVKNSRVGRLLLNIGAPQVVANSLSRAYYYQNELLQ
ncbi:hypothetical protein J437_LFUL009546 [Ladona fulva]|uniref:DRBM domain-containing protein n=1 Tax=Ladona fulva TaxID=123851 RepID=A0A8K0P3E4_LADFU|nr:hypothetical protein J437_LFUL009546 [Ladona fulva]